MTDTCKKCQQGGMKGPRYAKDMFSECLLYVCQVCGYVEERPTKDREEQELHPIREPW